MTEDDISAPSPGQTQARHLCVRTGGRLSISGKTLPKRPPSGGDRLRKNIGGLYAYNGKTLCARIMPHTPPPSDAAALLSALRPRIESRARALTRSRVEAEDLAQEGMLRLWARLQRGTAPEHPEAYAMTLLRHLAISRWRARAETAPLEEDSATIPPTTDARLALHDARRAIARLPEPQRAVLARVLEGETSPAAIARALGLPKGTVMSRLARARAALRGTLQEPDENSSE